MYVIQEVTIIVIVLMLFVTLVVTLSDTDRYQAVRAHDFSTTDESSLITLVEQIKGETQLVIADSLSHYYFSAKVHAKNAAALIKELENNLTQTSPPSSDITQIYDRGLQNSTTLALVIANIVDDVLRKYGSAFAVGYDMTNMSNMMSMDMTNMDMMPKMDNSPSRPVEMAASTTNGSGILNRQLSTSKYNETSLALVNEEDYETAKVL